MAIVRKQAEVAKAREQAEVDRKNRFAGEAERWERTDIGHETMQMVDQKLYNAALKCTDRVQVKLGDQSRHLAAYILRREGYDVREDGTGLTIVFYGDSFDPEPFEYGDVAVQQAVQEGGDTGASEGTGLSMTDGDSDSDGQSPGSEASDDEDTDDLESMDRDALAQLMTDMGLEVPKGKAKAKMIELIREAESTEKV